MYVYFINFTHSQKGHHPLYAASFDGRLECVELLLNHNAQIDLPMDVSYHCIMYYQCSLAMHMTVSLITPRACARGKVIGSVVIVIVVVSKKITNLEV